MRKQFYISLISLLVLSFLGVVMINFFLPLLPGGVISVAIGLMIEFILISLGVITVVLMGDVLPSPLSSTVVAIIGMLSLAFYLYSVKIRSLSMSIAALLLWVCVGTWSTFWGLAYSIQSRTNNDIERAPQKLEKQLLSL